MNAFESGVRRVIPAVLIYAFRGEEVLMLQRGGKPEDFHAGKWNGLGGKLDADESPLEAAQREFQEEAGLALPLERFCGMGVIQFPNFKPHRHEDWVVWLFTLELSAGEEPDFQACPEGVLHWIPRSRVLELPLWPGDQLFLSQVLRQTPITGSVWYSNGEVVRSLFINAPH